jgi:hypothetical protein
MNGHIEGEPIIVNSDPYGRTLLTARVAQDAGFPVEIFPHQNRPGNTDAVEQAFGAGGLGITFKPPSLRGAFNQIMCEALSYSKTAILCAVDIGEPLTINLLRNRQIDEFRKLNSKVQYIELEDPDVLDKLRFTAIQRATRASIAVSDEDTQFYLRLSNLGLSPIMEMSPQVLREWYSPLVRLLILQSPLYTTYLINQGAREQTEALSNLDLISQHN